MQMLTGIDQSDYSKIEAGKRYMAIVEMEHEDGYSFALDREDMYGSINGNKAIVSPVYSTDELALDYEGF